MKEFVLRVAVMMIRCAAALVGLFVKQENCIVLISCQDDKPTQDMLDLSEEIGRIPFAPSVRVTAGRMERSVGGAFAFAGRFLLMLKDIAAARIVVLDAYCPAVSIPKKRPGQKVVQIWHAPDAIKKFSLQILDTNAGYESRTAAILDMHQGYDYILCPSDATRPFFSEAFGYPESSFVKYALPSLDRVGLMRRPSVNMEESPARARARAVIYQRYSMIASRPNNVRAAASESDKRFLTIVYAPTFRDGSVVDAEGLVRAFEQASKDSRVPIWLIFKPHPLDAVRNGDAEILLPGNVILDMDFPLIDWYALADAVITDYSGAAIEAAAANVASYYYIYDFDDYKARRGLNIDLRTEAIGKYAFFNAELLAAQVIRDHAGYAEENALNGNNPGENTTSGYDYYALSIFAKKYLEVPFSGNARRLADFIVGLSGNLII